MNQTYATRVKAAASAVLLALLAACAGGDDLTTPASPLVSNTTKTTTTADISIEGTAAVGAPLANAKVSILCNSGDLGKETNSDTTGKYSTTVTAACIAPYMVKVTGVDTTTTPTSTITLYAFADKAGNINITPLTDIAAKFATNNDPDGEYNAVLSLVKKTDSLWGTSTKAAAQANLQKVLDKLGVTSTIALGDLLHGKFDAKLGDKTDDILEKLKKERGGVSLKDLVEQIANRGGNTLTATERKPWLALFPQQKSFTLTATGCSGNYQNGQNNSGNIETSLSNASVTATFALTTTGFKISTVISQAASVSPRLIALSSVVAPDFVFTTGEFQLTAINNLLNFYANKPDSSEIVNVSAAKSTSTVANAQSIRMEVRASGPGQPSFDLNCQQSLPTITAASRPDFSIPARIASLAGTATSITSAALEGGACQIFDEKSATANGSYTYAVSAATGDIKFNGQSLATNWFLGANAQYREHHSFGGEEPYSLIQLNMGPVSQTLPTIASAKLQRNFFGNSPFTHSCNRNNILQAGGVG